MNQRVGAFLVLPALLLAVAGSSQVTPGGGGTSGGGAATAVSRSAAIYLDPYYDVLISISADDHTLPQNNISGTRVDVNTSATIGARIFEDDPPPAPEHDYEVTNVQLEADGFVFSEDGIQDPEEPGSAAGGRVSSLRWSHDADFTLKAIAHIVMVDKDTRAVIGQPFTKELSLLKADGSTAYKVYNTFGGVKNTNMYGSTSRYIPNDPDDPINPYDPYDPSTQTYADPVLWIKEFDDITTFFSAANYTRIGNGNHSKANYLSAIHNTITAGNYTTEGDYMSPGFRLGSADALKGANFNASEYSSNGELSTSAQSNTTAPSKNLLLLYACSVLLASDADLISAFNVAPHGAVLGFKSHVSFAIKKDSASGDFPILPVIGGLISGNHAGDYFYRHSKIFIDHMNAGARIKDVLQILNDSYIGGQNITSYDNGELVISKWLCESYMVMADASDDLRSCATSHHVFLTQSERSSLASGSVPESQIIYYPYWYYSSSSPSMNPPRSMPPGI